ncbi:MAG: HAD family hydrolase [Candidatus Aenigmarchaeota archaeon]|nr:HAD family hydrolase [Candidatus Aenigmarchaeota archaeon]MDW8149062.1 HAD family hydrolase [Candidatus Aenigmarchaeota archaeon]
MDGTLVDKGFDDYFWFYVVPHLLSKYRNIDFNYAIELCVKEYESLDRNDYKWYSPTYWFHRFGIKENVASVINSIGDKVKVFPEVKNVLERLSKKYKLMLFTLCTREFFPVKLYRTGLSIYFSEIISITDDFKLGCKSEEAFRKLLKHTKLNPDDMIYIGNDYYSDYLIPIRVGIKSILVDRNGRQTNSIKSLEELKL